MCKCMCVDRLNKIFKEEKKILYEIILMEEM